MPYPNRRVTRTERHTTHNTRPHEQTSKPFGSRKAARRGGGQRPWRAVLYAPSAGYTLFRISFKEEIEEAWAWTTRTAATEREARRTFTQVERALDDLTATPVRANVTRTRTGDALGDAYLLDSKAREKAARTIEQRKSRLRRHIRPVLGDVQVAQWQLHHSRQVIEQARARG